MKRILGKNPDLSFSALLIGFFCSLFILFSAYKILGYLSIQKFTDVTNLQLFMHWMHIALDSKNFFKLSYNVSIVFLPISSVLIALLVKYYVKDTKSLLKGVLIASFVYIFLVYLPENSLFLQFIIANTFVLVVFVGSMKIRSSFFKRKRSFIYIKRFFMLPDSLINICNRLEIVKSITWFFNTHWIETLLVILVVTLFNFGYFAEAGIWVNYYHHNFMIATINDLFQGKHLLVDTFNQYGLLYPYFLYLLFKIFIPLSYLNLYFLFMILTMLYFLIYFFFLKQLIQRTTLSLVGLYVAIGLYTLFHLHIFPTSENYVWPGGIPLRHFFDVTVFFLLLKNKNFHSRTLSWMGAVFCALALFYNLETGISLVIAYSCFHLFVIFANSTNNSIDKIVFFLARIIQLMMCILALLASISIYTYYQSGHFPDWKLFSFFALLYQAGFTSMPTPKIGVYLLYLFVYFAVVTVILYRVVISKPVSWKWFVMSSLSVYGLFTINYYMGRSTPTNLPLNSVSFVTLILYMFVEVQSWLREVRNRSYFILLKNARSILFLILFFLVIKTSFNLIERINYRVAIFLEVQNLKKYPFNRGFIVLPYTETPGFTGDDLLASVAEIKKLTKGTKKILLFSRFDVVILTMAEKTLLVPYPMLEQIYFVSDLKRIGNELVKLKNKPSYLFIEKRTENPFEESTAGKVTSYDSARYLFSALSPYYEFKKQVGILDVYQLKE